MLLSMSSAGISMSGADVGGFHGAPTDELHVRWYQIAVFQSFYRGHSSQGSIRREPWLFKKQTCEAILHAIKLRY